MVDLSSDRERTIRSNLDDCKAIDMVSVGRVYLSSRDLSSWIDADVAGLIVLYTTSKNIHVITLFDLSKVRCTLSRLVTPGDLPKGGQEGPCLASLVVALSL